MWLVDATIGVTSVCEEEAVLLGWWEGLCMAGAVVGGWMVHA